MNYHIVLEFHHHFLQIVCNNQIHFAKPSISMATLIANGICCCFGCCCQSISDALARWLGPQRVTKVFYLFLVMIFSVPAIIILFFINKWQGFLLYFSWMTCPSSSGGQFDCIGPSTVFRISLSFLVLFLLMLIVMLFRSRISMVINQGLFCIKYLLVLGVFIAFLFANNNTFVQYSDASKYISIVFMVLQSIILIDLFYLAGIKLVARYDKGQSSCGFVLILLTIICQCAAIGQNVLGYIYFSSSDDCGNSLWVNVITTIIIVALPVLQIFNFNKQNSLLTTALVSMYVSYLAFICQFSYGDNCTDRMTESSLIADIIVSTFFFVLTMYGSIMGGSGQIKVTQNGDINKAMGIAPTEPIEEAVAKNDASHRQQPSKQQEQSQASNLAKYTESWAWAKWHFYMCLASIYVGMLITNWTSASLVTGYLTSSGFGFWVRVALSWATALLYIWTLLAPKVFPERDFTVV